MTCPDLQKCCNANKQNTQINKVKGVVDEKVCRTKLGCRNVALSLHSPPLDYTDIFRGNPLIYFSQRNWTFVTNYNLWITLHNFA